MDNKKLIVCPKCARHLYMPSDWKTLQIACPYCKTTWDWLPSMGAIQEAHAHATGNGGPPAAESVQERLTMNSQGAVEAAEGVTFACTSCQHSICIPNPENAPIHLTLFEDNVQELASHGIPRKGQSLTCPRCEADFILLSTNQFQAYCEQVEVWHEALNGIDAREALGIRQVFVFPMTHINISSSNKLSNLTFAGWLLILSSASAGILGSLLIAFLLSKFGPENDLGLRKRIGIAVVIASPIIFIGGTMFFAGKWLLEKKRGVVVVKTDYPLRIDKERSAMTELVLATRESVPSHQDASDRTEDNGVFQCNNCKHFIDLRQALHLDMCPKCGANCAEDMDRLIKERVLSHYKQSTHSTTVVRFIVYFLILLIASTLMYLWALRNH